MSGYDLLARAGAFAAIAGMTHGPTSYLFAALAGFNVALLLVEDLVRLIVWRRRRRLQAGLE